MVTFIIIFAVVFILALVFGDKADKIISAIAGGINGFLLILIMIILLIIVMAIRA
jgi:hypothetical protein